MPSLSSHPLSEHPLQILSQKSPQYLLSQLHLPFISQVFPSQ